MSIKDRGKKYAEFLDFLRKEYIAKYGKESEGLADTMLKRKAAEKVDEMMKVIPFPEKNITDWTKDRPKTGPKADVKTFPKQKKLTPEPKTSIERLEKELEEMEKLGQPYKDTSVSDFMSDYFDMPQKAPPKKTITELNNVKLYGDETFEELQIIKDTGKHPRNKAAGGRVKYENGSDPKSYDVPTESPLKISGNFSKSKDREVLDYVAALEIPVSEKIKLIGELTGVNFSFQDQYGKYKYDDLIKSIGLNFNEDGEGFSGYGKYNMDTGKTEGGIKFIKKFNEGGRIGYAEGMSAEEAVAARLPPNYKFLEDADLKRSPEGIVMEGYQDTTTLDMLRDALKKQERRTPLVEYDDGTLYYPEFDEYYKEDGKQVEGPAFWAKPIPKLFEVPKHSERKSIDLANGGRIGFKFGTKKRGDKIKSIIEEVNKKLKTKTTGGEVKLTVDIPESPKAELQRMFDEFNQRFKKKTRSSKKEYERLKDEEPERMAEYDAMWSDEEPVQMSMEDLIEFRSQNPAGKGRFTRAEAIIARLENTIQDAKNNPDETSDYVLTNFPNMIEELKNKPELANNENVWKELGMTGLPENQRFKLYDDGTVDFETLKPTHQFKLREDIKRKLNAEGGLNYLMGL
jgi:hypothetical protein